MLTSTSTRFDWYEIQIAAEDDLEGDRHRAELPPSLIKNLFFGTERSILRKGAEVTLVPVAEIVLGKQRILEIYLVWFPKIVRVVFASFVPTCRNHLGW
jgi:hypothetical protein